jgi:DNA-binding HxlR family transcriptional regulator
MKRSANKSSCPINGTVELFGDTWSLLIVRDMLALGKNTFGEFLDSEERIGPSVLADRLAHLETRGIIAKRRDETDKRKTIYSLTEAGLDVIPIVYEFALWGSCHSSSPKAPPAWFASMRLDREEVIAAWRTAAASGSSFLYGPNSVVKQLGL